MSFDGVASWSWRRLIVCSNPTAARLWRRPQARGVAVSELMVEYMIPEFRPCVRHSASVCDSTPESRCARVSESAYREEIPPAPSGIDVLARRPRPCAGTPPRRVRIHLLVPRQGEKWREEQGRDQCVSLHLCRADMVPGTMTRRWGDTDAALPEGSRGEGGTVTGQTPERLSA